LRFSTGTRQRSFRGLLSRVLRSSRTRLRAVQRTRRLGALACLGVLAACASGPGIARLSPPFSGVVTRAGAPVAGARVLLSLQERDEDCAQPSARAETDAAGRFELEPVSHVYLFSGPPGSFHVWNVCIQSSGRRFLGYTAESVGGPPPAPGPLRCELDGSPSQRVCAARTP